MWVLIFFPFRHWFFKWYAGNLYIKMYTFIFDNIYNLSFENDTWEWAEIHLENYRRKPALLYQKHIAIICQFSPYEHNLLFMEKIGIYKNAIVPGFHQLDPSYRTWLRVFPNFLVEVPFRIYPKNWGIDEYILSRHERHPRTI